MTSQNDQQDFSFILSCQNNNKLSCGVMQWCSCSYCTLCFAVISNVTFFGKTYANDNPLFVRKLKDS